MIPKHLLKKADSELEKIGYQAVCVICSKVFFDSTLLGVKKLLADGKWRDDLPMMWYVEAARHWIEKPEAVIHIYLVIEGRRELFFSLTDDWLRQVGSASKEQMINELNYLERKIEETTIK